jgi:ribose-phosphate pyrophosphokinase
MSLIEELPIAELVVCAFHLYGAPILIQKQNFQVTNSIPQNKHESLCKKLVTIDVSPMIAESIRRTHNGESISFLFGEWADTVEAF